MKSYLTRQNEWLKANNLKIGDKVKVVRKAESHEDDWGNSWIRNMEVGKILSITDIDTSSTGNSSGIRLKDGFYYPYFSLEPYYEKVGMWSDGTEERTEEIKKFFKEFNNKHGFFYSDPKSFYYYDFDMKYMRVSSEVPEGYQEINPIKSKQTMEKSAQFGVKATTFTLYQAFKEEAEARGWTYVNEFNEFTNENAKKRLFYFAGLPGGEPWSKAGVVIKGFSLTGNINDSKPTYNLPQDWDKAIEALNVEIEPQSVEVSIAKCNITTSHDSFKIEILKDGSVKSGCQTYSKDNFIELLSAVKRLMNSKLYDSHANIFVFEERTFSKTELKNIIEKYEEFVGIKINY